MDDKTLKAMKDLHDTINSVNLVMDAMCDRSYDADGSYTSYFKDYHMLQEVCDKLKKEYRITFGHDWYNYYDMPEVIARIRGSHAETVAR